MMILGHRWQVAVAGVVSLVAFAVAIALVVFESQHAESVRAETGSESSFQQANLGVLGDVDCSESVQVRDVLEVRRWAARLGTPADCLAFAGDTNCDGEPDAADALQLLRFLAGLSNPAVPGCDAIGSDVGEPVSSFQLIDAAFDESEIDLATALLYKAYAAFHDSRLPGEFQGNDARVQDNPFLHAVLESWEALSEDERDALLPFLLPPNLPGSWYDQQQAAGLSLADADDWATIVSATLPVKVWYHPARPGDAARAEFVVAELEGTIWNSLVGLMGRGPLPDCGSDCFSGGGDDRFDIYLADLPTSYVTWNPPYFPDCSNVPAFMVLGDSSKVTLAHEFMHAIQLAFDGPSDCEEYRWVSEATANWTNDYVYPGNNQEHFNSVVFFHSPDRRLDLVNQSHEYAAYLYPFFLAHRLSPQAIRDIWLAGESKVSSLAAVNQATSGAGGFEALWPEFALHNWNQEPVDDYHDWDAIEGGARASRRTFGEGESLLLKTVDYLGAAYYSYEFTEEVGYVEFSNTLAGRAHIKVQAIVSLDGSWQEPEDWSEESRKSFCRNLSGQNIDRLVIVVSNSDWQGKTTLEMENDPPKVRVAPESCTALVGSASTTYTTSSGHIGHAGTTDVRFEFDEERNDYRPASGTVTWTYDGMNGTCTVHGSGAFPLSENEGRIFIAEPDLNGDQRYYATGHRPTTGNYQATRTCPDGGVYPYNMGFNLIWLWANVSSGHIVEEDGQLRGTDQQESGGGSNLQTWEWDLRPAP